MIIRPLFPGGFCAAVQQSSARYVSSKYPRPTPRPYRRRLYEAAVAPVLPQKLGVCTNNLVKSGKQEYDPVELALCRVVKKWMTSEEYRVMAICQFLPVAGRTLWLSKNQLRLKGVEFRSYGNRILRKTFEDYMRYSTTCRQDFRRRTVPRAVYESTQNSELSAETTAYFEKDFIES
ncbi:hypothetical protein Y032_0049g1807 [Ancylostoma ceylanicum]|uniref:Uncharacterized protein n=2 Tax=Ancylostoma ceylanicum TaxID=53326 RepID=A0A016U948_9BILA|nr:hypothetical protein Y032_0049g1807 [Ancylostoma ceylanicum]